MFMSSATTWKAGMGDRDSYRAIDFEGLCSAMRRRALVLRQISRG
jgi:hypothetical protein